MTTRQEIIENLEWESIECPFLESFDEWHDDDADLRHQTPVSDFDLD